MIAVDPSLNGTGLAFYDLFGDIVTRHVKVKNLRGTARLSYVKSIVREHIAGEDVVVYESYAFGAKGRAIFDIGEMGGVLKTLCYEEGVDVLLVNPSTLKIFVTGNGKAKKDEVGDYISVRWNRKFSNDDEADAFALLKLGEAYFSKKTRRACSHKVKESLAKCELVKGKICS